MSLLGDFLEGLSRAWERATVHDERDRIAAARARAVYKLRRAEQEAAEVAARLEQARLAAIAAAEAEELYSAAESEAAARAAEGREP